MGGERLKEALRVWRGRYRAAKRAPWLGHWTKRLTPEGWRMPPARAGGAGGLLTPPASPQISAALASMCCPLFGKSSAAKPRSVRKRPTTPSSTRQPITSWRNRMPTP